MPFNPLLVAVLMLCGGAVLGLTALGPAVGVHHDASLLTALVHVELVLAALFFFPRKGRGSAVVARNVLWLLACFAVSSACVGLFSYVARGDVALASRPGVLGAWVFAGGWIALGASVGGPWAARLKVLVLCVFALPALWHYLALEYSGAAMLHLRWLSPSWSFAAGELDWWPMLPVGVLPWVAALVWPALRRNPRPATAAALLLPALLAPGLAAQTIDTERSRFVTEPHGRPGTCAPYRLSLTPAADTTEVAVVLGNTRLVRTFATTPGEATDVILPVFVADGVRIEVGEDSHTPRLPLRRVEPDYEQPYVAVFAADAMYARPIVPSAQGVMVCDYFENREFFADWRMLDGYDGIILFQPEGQRLPSGSQQAIAEFCSLGGAAVIVGSFELGEAALDLPAPSEPEIMSFGGVRVQRFGYGPGAIYRVGFNELRDSQNAHRILRDVMRDHLWFQQTRAPGGAPPTRAPLPQAPLLRPAPPEQPGITPLFFALAGGLLVICGVVPLLGRRLRGGAWWAAPAVALLAVGVGAAATLQDRPVPAVDVWTLAHVGDGGLGWTRTYVLAEPDWDAPGTVNLASDRALVRPWRSGTGQRGWQVDRPLQRVVPGQESQLAYGEVDGQRFRDFGTRAQRGETQFTLEQATLLAWWLDENTYRGRFAALAPGEWELPPDRFEGASVRDRGVLTVSNHRQRQ